MPDAREPKVFYGYIVVVAAFFIMVVMWGTFYTFGVLFKPLLEEFGWTRAMTSGAFSLNAFLHGLFAIVLGRLTDKFGPRIVIVASGLLLGLGYLLMSQTATIWQLYLFYGVMLGIGMGGGVVPLVSPVARWFARRRGMMTGIVFAGMGAGTMIMPPIANWLISSYEWRNSYIILGLITLVFIILAAQLLRRDPAQMELLPDGDEAKEESPNLDASGFSLREAIHTQQFWTFCAMIACFLFILYTMMAHVVAHAIGLGISATTATSILAVIGGLNVAGTLAIGPFADRVGTKPAMILSFSLTAVALFWLLVASEIWMLYLFAGIYGLAYGGLAVLFSPMTAELFGLRSHGVIFGMVSFAGTVGMATGPVLAGRIFDITNSYQIAFLISAVVAVIGLILASLLRPVISQGGTNGTGKSA